MLKAAFALVTLLACAVGAQAQEEEGKPLEQQQKTGIQITFLPPPIPGTISLGIYNKAGKLIRVLHREATEKAFTVGLNGLITQWDGKDDAGMAAPAGKYQARGYSVGALEVEGEAYHCNDFMVDEDSPRVSRLLDLRPLPTGELVVAVKLVNEETTELMISEGGGVKKPEQGTPQKVEGSDPKPSLSIDGKTIESGSLPDLQKPIDVARGKDNTLWIIDETSSGVEVKQYSAHGEFLRRLAVVAGEPAPYRIVASTTEDRIYLLETASNVQRVRGLMREESVAVAPAQRAEAGEASLSTWKTLFAKQIVASGEFTAVADKLGRPQAFTPEPRISVRLLPNPLYKNMPANAAIEIAHDAEGSYLRTVDSLPLVRLTETPHLKWAVMGRESGSRAVTIFQSDGAVVEEFRVRRLANMMAFDAGEYKWTGRAEGVE
ncbi:MAG: hypothetical protein EOP84_06965 [Verrucomicrobiaceae bacterium]|nr:MAG: hypothetical protein EOP84_06965 [Verrucomicrobiaceae bacterium]